MGIWLVLYGDHVVFAGSTGTTAHEIAKKLADAALGTDHEQHGRNYFRKDHALGDLPEIWVDHIELDQTIRLDTELFLLGKPSALDPVRS